MRIRIAGLACVLRSSVRYWLPHRSRGHYATPFRPGRPSTGNTRAGWSSSATTTWCHGPNRKRPSGPFAPPARSAATCGDKGITASAAPSLRQPGPGRPRRAWRCAATKPSTYMACGVVTSIMGRGGYWQFRGQYTIQQLCCFRIRYTVPPIPDLRGSWLLSGRNLNGGCPGGEVLEAKDRRPTPKCFSQTPYVRPTIHTPKAASVIGHQDLS
jgi:hypothetical protein